MKVGEKVKCDVDPKLFEYMDEQSQIVVHCMLATDEEEIYLRIWPSTYLVCRQTKTSVPLLHHENISVFPTWTPVAANSKHFFTLYFKGLPKGCKSFDLEERIPQSGGFVVRKIIRNEADVYRVVMD